MGRALFHPAFSVMDLEEAKRFSVDGVGCRPGRESSRALALELRGHQLAAHRTAQAPPPQQGIDPRHFGLVFTEEADWQALVARAKAKGLTFYQEPRRRRPGTRIEHRTFFLEDPFHNLLEFKYDVHESAIVSERAHASVGDRVEAK